MGKSKSFKESTKDSNMTLVPLRNKSVNFDESDNIIIEGDNLEVLKLLEKSYFNKIDVIYIDPPYNTGNDFVYDDDYSQSKFEFDKENNLINEEGDRLQTKNQKSDGRFHTKWLNMIYPRLILARKLLKDDGVIFISIDDNEQARLKLLCDEIFGENNFICNFIIKLPDGNNINKLSIIHEYCLMYSKSKSFSINDLKTPAVKKELIESRLTNKGNVESTIIFPKGLKIEGGGDHCFKNIVGGKQEIIKLSSNMIFKNGLLAEDVELTAEWRSPNILKKLFSNPNEKIFDKKGNQYLLPFFNSKGNPKINKIRESTNIRSCLEFSTGTKTLQKLSLNFNYSKSVEFVSFIISLINKKESIILDFFAGSGTTAQAVMELNKEDGGNRKYILVQYPEKSENLKDTGFETIADITRERVKRAIDMFQYKEKGYKAFELVESNLKSFDASTSDPVGLIQTKFEDYENKIKENTSIENLIYEIILRVGELPLNTKIESKILYNNKVYYDELKYCLFLLEPAIDSNYYNIENIIKIVKNFYSNNLKIYLNDKYFENDQDKINFAESIKNIKDGSWEIELVVI